MKLTMLEKITCFPPGSPIGVYHFGMFHGEAVRPGAPYLRYVYDYDDKLEFPLHVRRNAYNAPSVFQPNVSLILASPIADSLSRFEGHYCLPVIYDAVYWKQYEKWEFPRKLYRDTEKVLSELKPIFDVTPPECTELIVPILNRHVESNKVSQVEFLKRRGGRKTFEISVEYVDKMPIFWSSGICFREDAYAAIAEYVDPDYFDIFECEL